MAVEDVLFSDGGPRIRVDLLARGLRRDEALTSAEAASYRLAKLVLIDAAELVVASGLGTVGELAPASFSMPLALLKGRCFPTRPCDPPENLEEARLWDVLFFAGDIQKAAVTFGSDASASDLLANLESFSAQISQGFEATTMEVVPFMGLIDPVDALRNQTILWRLKGAVIEGTDEDMRRGDLASSL